MHSLCAFFQHFIVNNPQHFPHTHKYKSAEGKYMHLHWYNYQLTFLACWTSSVDFDLLFTACLWGEVDCKDTPHREKFSTVKWALSKRAIFCQLSRFYKPSDPWFSRELRLGVLNRIWSSRAAACQTEKRMEQLLQTRRAVIIHSKLSWSVSHLTTTIGHYSTLTSVQEEQWTLNKS